MGLIRTRLIWMKKNSKNYKSARVASLSGLGIEVGMEDGFVKVISPIDDTPAQRAGLQAGDLIIRLNETPKSMTLNDAVKLMRGKPDTNIDLLVVREGKDKPLQSYLKTRHYSGKALKTACLNPVMAMYG